MDKLTKTTFLSKSRKLFICPACGKEVNDHPEDRCLDAWILCLLQGREFKPLECEDLKEAEIPHYSSKYEDAFELVEKFRRGDYGEQKVACHFQLTVYEDGEEDVKAYVQSPSQKPVQAYGSSIPLAVARMTIKVLEKERDI